MNKWSKTFLIICSLVLLLLSLVIVSLTWPWGTSSAFLYAIREFFFANYYAHMTLFWLGIAVAAASVIAIIVVLFVPHNKTTFRLKDDRGKLTIHKKAIDGVVRSMLNEKDFIGSPKVNTTATNRKIHVNVSGDIKRTSALADHMEEWSARVEERVRNLVGSDHNVKVKVKLERYQKRGNATSSGQPRVE
ncbi:Hypothetical protein ADU71_0542 [Pediococcus damnosus]|uniref:alkaline shock response membrane anchor protein AmaP n=1 Tax=Pediococcus damnosus TaxID=51663 RepID=UPI00078B37A6|nr:alkaline shock response membrane anchor protein AmaP [Pediococcus damnosus]AMV60211.1 Hypothetical protein ADU69_0537 [Pediococcus damnosus]AMV64461.1 Hypothetical protein ADU71_0542 [Pediococcus damnosus]